MSHGGVKLEKQH